MSEMTATNATGATGGVKILLRLEGLTLFAGMTLLYAVWGGSWWIYVILFLVPDLSFAGYLVDAKTGAIVLKDSGLKAHYDARTGVLTWDKRKYEEVKAEKK